jgi:hypothetical protein
MDTVYRGPQLVMTHHGACLPTTSKLRLKHLCGKPGQCLKHKPINVLGLGTSVAEHMRPMQVLRCVSHSQSLVQSLTASHHQRTLLRNRSTGSFLATCFCLGLPGCRGGSGGGRMQRSRCVRAIKAVSGSQKCAKAAVLGLG